MRLIHPLVILKILSTILLVEALTFTPTIFVALIYDEPAGPFLWSAIITFSVYLFLHLLSFKGDVEKMSNRDTFLIVTSAWVLFSVFGAFPYLLSRTIPSFIDALFESTSGFTTTGASILSDVEVLPHSILFWRSFTHWVGGIGIIVLVILILPSLRILGYQLFSLESSMKEKIHPRATGIAFRIMFIYVSLTIVEIILLVSGDMNLFESVCHAFGTVATGGFSTRNAGLMAFSPYSQYVVMVFMFLAGISQVVYYYVGKLNFRKVKNNEELRVYFITILVAGILATTILLFNHERSPEEAIREGFFNIISVITCTGFASADFVLWPAAGMALIFLLFFSGGSTGSTSGGIKIARHLVVLKNIKRIFIKLNHPNTIITIRLNGKAIDEKTNNTIISFLLLYLFLFVIGTVLLTAVGSDIVTSASSVATCMAGIGPGLGTVGPMSNYSTLPEISKIALSILMIIGRLEIVTVFVLFGKSFWKL